MGSTQSPGTVEELSLRAPSEADSPEAAGESAPKIGKKLWEIVSFPVVLTFIILTLVFTLGHGLVGDPDIWWHLHNADYLVQHHSLPRYDTYSYTVPGHPWINHEWLAELPYYVAWRALGISGIDALSVAILSFIFLGVLYLAYRESGNFKAAVLATAYAIFLARVSFGPRTILFGYAYLVVLLIILQRFRQKGNAPLWLIPPLFCLWVNTHGSWSIGLIIFSVIIAAGLFPMKWGMVESDVWTAAQRKNLIISWCASIALLFLNPFGARLVFYPLDLAFHQKTNIEHVAEWVSVDFHGLRGKIVLGVIIILLLSALLRPRRWSLGQLAVLLFALYSGLTYIRFLFLLGIIAAPVLAEILDFVPPYRPERDTPLINLAAVLVMIAGIAYYWPHPSRLQNTVDTRYPAQAMSYLKTHPPQGRILNTFLWGGYVNWKDPNVKVFIDSRVDIFDYTGVFKDYLDILSLNNSYALLDKYKIRYIFLQPDEPLTYVIQHNPNWKTVYSDKVSVLIEKAGDPQGGERPN